MTVSPLFLLSFILLAGAGASLGVWMNSVPEVSRRVVPFSGAVLIFIALFWVWPEISGTFGWPYGTALMLTGFGLLWSVNRFVYPVCPSCSHTHDHDACSTRLHGFATPLLAATLIHSAFDGWALAAAQSAPALEFGHAMSAGLWIHKLPESIAFGVILKAAMASRRRALFWAISAQLIVLAGAGLEYLSAPYVGMRWITVLLAMGGGTFLFLGYHAVEGEWKRRTAQRAVAVRVHDH